MTTTRHAVRAEAALALLPVAARLPPLAAAAHWTRRPTQRQLRRMQRWRRWRRQQGCCQGGMHPIVARHPLAPLRAHLCPRPTAAPPRLPRHRHPQVWERPCASADLAPGDGWAARSTAAAGTVQGTDQCTAAHPRSAAGTRPRTAGRTAVQHPAGQTVGRTARRRADCTADRNRRTAGGNPGCLSCLRCRWEQRHRRQTRRMRALPPPVGARTSPEPPLRPQQQQPPAAGGSSMLPPDPQQRQPHTAAWRYPADTAWPHAAADSPAAWHYPADTAWPHAAAGSPAAWHPRSRLRPAPLDTAWHQGRRRPRPMHRCWGQGRRCLPLVHHFQ